MTAHLRPAPSRADQAREALKQAAELTTDKTLRALLLAIVKAESLGWQACMGSEDAAWTLRELATEWADAATDILGDE